MCIVFQGSHLQFVKASFRVGEVSGTLVPPSRIFEILTTVRHFREVPLGADKEGIPIRQHSRGPWLSLSYFLRIP